MCARSSRSSGLKTRGCEAGMRGLGKGNPEVPPGFPYVLSLSLTGKFCHNGLRGAEPRPGPAHHPGVPARLLRPASPLGGRARRRPRPWRARGLQLRTVVGVAGVLVERDDLHALLAVQVIVQLLRAAAEARAAPQVPAAAAALGRARARGSAEAQVLGG